MAQNQGTLVGGPIRPLDSEDTFPTAYTNEIKGGIHFGPAAGRFNVPLERREWGMLYIPTDGLGAHIYILANGYMATEDIDLSNNENWIPLVEYLSLLTENDRITLGETQWNAYRGDRGKIAYDHAQITSGNPHGVTKADVGLSKVVNIQQVTIEDVGQPDGVAPLDSNGFISPKYLPSYVDDVVDIIDFVDHYGHLPKPSGFNEGDRMYVIDEMAIYRIESGNWDDSGGGVESGKIYIRLNDTDQAGQSIITQWRWSGSEMVQIMSSALVLGETEYTAYRGDRGKAAYDHSLLTTGNPHNVTKAQVGLGSVDNTSDMSKPVSTAQAAAISAVQNDLNNYRTSEVGESFPDYSSQLISGLNF